MSEIKVDKISPQSGTALQIGDASDVITIPASATITNLGTATGFGGASILQIISKQDGTIRTDTTNASYVATSGYNWAELQIAITPASTSNYLWVVGSFGISGNNGYSQGYWVTFHNAGGTETPHQGDTANSRAMTGMIDNAHATTARVPASAVSILHNPNTTSEVTIRVRTQTTSAAHPVCFHQDQAGSTNTDDGGNMCSNLTVMEISSTISPSVTNTQINS